MTKHKVGKKAKLKMVHGASHSLKHTRKRSRKRSNK